eukprot:10045410-Alexandrium_andersonii.AAC.1
MGVGGPIRRYFAIAWARNRNATTSSWHAASSRAPRCTNGATKHRVNKQHRPHANLAAAVGKRCSNAAAL